MWLYSRYFVLGLRVVWWWLVLIFIALCALFRVRVFYEFVLVGFAAFVWVCLLMLCCLWCLAYDLR